MSNYPRTLITIVSCEAALGSLITPIINWCHKCIEALVAGSASDGQADDLSKDLFA